MLLESPTSVASTPTPSSSAPESPSRALWFVGGFQSLRTASRTSAFLGLVGIAVLVLWGSWWVSSLKKGQLKSSPAAWFERHHFLGLDFLHNYHAARYWVNGGNPYQEPFGDPLGRKLCYLPIVLPFFAWCSVLSPQAAVATWTAAVAILAGLGAFASWSVRRNCGLAPVPLSFAVAAVLVSAPVAYAMERGNFDLLIVPMLLGAAWALQSRSLGRDALAGSCLALAACFKVYPALLIVALLPLRRGRAAAFAVLAVGAFAAFQWENLPVCVSNIQELARVHGADKQAGISPSGHSLTGGWKLLWEGTRLTGLARIPGPVATLAVFGPMLLWVGERVYRCANAGPLVLPLFLWLAAVGTFVPAVANDYNLVFLPLAALAVWDRRDPVPVHLGMAALVLWAQPVAFEIDPAVLFGLKVLSTLAVGVSLAGRLGEITPADQPPGGGRLCPAK